MRAWHCRSSSCGPATRQFELDVRSFDIKPRSFLGIKVHSDVKVHSDIKVHVRLVLQAVV